MAVILITHDLGVVAETADRVAVMYAGRVVEYCDVRSAFRRPLHPYTAGLQASLPKLGDTQDRLRVIPGSVPNPREFPDRLPLPSALPRRAEPMPRAIPALGEIGTGTCRAACARARSPPAR